MNGHSAGREEDGKESPILERRWEKKISGA
jgi:hypothetical protein